MYGFVHMLLQPRSHFISSQNFLIKYFPSLLSTLGLPVNIYQLFSEYTPLWTAKFSTYQSAYYVYCAHFVECNVVDDGRDCEKLQLMSHKSFTTTGYTV